MKKYYPFRLIKYLSKEFLKCFAIILIVFLSISLLINFIEEIIFFKEKDINNLFFRAIYLTFLKTPNTLIETSIFIFLFSGIFFFVKFIKNNEINTVNLSGVSNLTIILTPAILSLMIGLFIVAAISPISSKALILYENNKRIVSQNDNLIVINDSGLWFMENVNNNYRIIRADKIINNDFSKLYNSTIYELDDQFNFLKRYDSKLIFINKKNWILEDVNILDKKNFENSNSLELNFKSSINIDDLKNIFSNVNSVSFWDILENIKIINLRGYSADELKIKFHKYLSLPIYLFSIIVLSTIFTIGIRKELSNFVYIFLGIVIGIIIHFLNDLSIALGIANKLPLVVSVWIPISLIIVISIINLLNINENS